MEVLEKSSSKQITIRIPNWYNLHRPYNLTLYPGITVLVGKNGSGKTTLLKQVREYCNKNGYKYFEYSDMRNGRSNGMEIALFHEDFNMVSTLFDSSEGQNVYNNFAYSLSKMGKFVREASEDKPSFILLDSIDSGLSIDLIREIKDFFNEVLLKDINNKPIYILVTTNQYEFTIGCRCINVKNGKDITFKSYKSYASFICRKRRSKQNG